VDITHALMDAGFNDTVTFVISFIWEMLEIGAKSWIWIFQMQFTEHVRTLWIIHWSGSSWEQYLDWLPVNWPNTLTHNWHKFIWTSLTNLRWTYERSLRETYIFNLGDSLCTGFIRFSIHIIKCTYRTHIDSVVYNLL